MTCFSRRAAWSSRTAICLSVLLGPLIGLSLSPLGWAEEPVRLTTDGRVKRDPVVWPGGKQVTYSTVTDDGVSRLMRLDLQDGSTSRFHADEDLPDRELTVNSDGSLYAYTYVTPDGQRGRIIVRNPQDGGKITLEPAKFGLWPSLAPDGTSIIFTVDATVIVSVDLTQLSANSTVAITPQTAGAVTRLSRPDVQDGDLWPKYSPDGRQIVFSSRRDNDFEIYLMNADGSGHRRLTDSPGVDAHPSFSPDGQRIAFTSARDGNYEIYTMKPDGSDVQRITRHAGRDDFATWHPSGDRLLFVSQRKGRYDLYALRLP